MQKNKIRTIIFICLIVAALAAVLGVFVSVDGGLSYSNATACQLYGHTWAVDEGVAATCTSSGLTEGKHCSVCGKVEVAQEVVPMHAHDLAAPMFVYTNGTYDNVVYCNNCHQEISRNFYSVSEFLALDNFSFANDKISLRGIVVAKACNSSFSNVSLLLCDGSDFSECARVDVDANKLDEFSVGDDVVVYGTFNPATHDNSLPRSSYMSDVTAFGVVAKDPSFSFSNVVRRIENGLHSAPINLKDSASYNNVSNNVAAYVGKLFAIDNYYMSFSTNGGSATANYVWFSYEDSAFRTSWSKHFCFAIRDLTEFHPGLMSLANGVVSFGGVVVTPKNVKPSNIIGRRIYAYLEYCTSSSFQFVYVADGEIPE